MPSRFCSYNGSGRCKRCACAGDGRACIDCAVGSKGRCLNIVGSSSDPVTELRTPTSQVTADSQPTSQSLSSSSSVVSLLPSSCPPSLAVPTFTHPAVASDLLGPPVSSTIGDNQYTASMSVSDAQRTTGADSTANASYDTKTDSEEQSCIDAQQSSPAVQVPSPAAQGPSPAVQAPPRPSYHESGREPAFIHYKERLGGVEEVDGEETRLSSSSFLPSFGSNGDPLTPPDENPGGQAAPAKRPLSVFFADVCSWVHVGPIMCLGLLPSASSYVFRGSYLAPKHI